MDKCKPLQRGNVNALFLSYFSHQQLQAALFGDSNRTHVIVHNGRVVQVDSINIRVESANGFSA